MKTFIRNNFVWGAFFCGVILYSRAGWATCGEISCYDPCTHSKVSLTGDKCAVTWVEESACFKAYAECEDSKQCLGALCFDACENHDHYFKKANTCKSIFNPVKLCWNADAKCE